jgi:hypothetical protein
MISTSLSVSLGRSVVVSEQMVLMTFLLTSFLYRPSQLDIPSLIPSQVTIHKGTQTLDRYRPDHLWHWYHDVHFVQYFETMGLIRLIVSLS